MGRGDLELLDIDMGRQTWPHPGPLCQSEPTCLPILGPEVRVSWPHPISVSYSQISLLFSRSTFWTPSWCPSSWDQDALGRALSPLWSPMPRGHTIPTCVCAPTITSA